MTAKSTKILGTAIDSGIGFLIGAKKKMFIFRVEKNCTPIVIFALVGKAVTPKAAPAFHSDVPLQGMPRPTKSKFFCPTYSYFYFCARFSAFYGFICCFLN